MALNFKDSFLFGIHLYTNTSTAKLQNDGRL